MLQAAPAFANHGVCLICSALAWVIVALLVRLKPQSWNIFGCLRTMSHAETASVGNASIARSRKPTRKTVTQTKTIAIHAVRSKPSLARGRFSA